MIPSLGYPLKPLGECSKVQDSPQTYKIRTSQDGNHCSKGRWPSSSNSTVLTEINTVIDLEHPVKGAYQNAWLRAPRLQTHSPQTHRRLCFGSIILTLANTKNQSHILISLVLLITLAHTHLILGEKKDRPTKYFLESRAVGLSPHFQSCTQWAS